MNSRSWILHLDLDAFFAAVEQRDKPSLRGKPVVVGGTGSRGVVATASYEARAFGIRSAMSTAEARRRCHHAAVLGGRFDTYIRDSQTVMDVLRGISARIEPLSLDEAYVDLGPQEFDYETMSELATHIQAQILVATGGLTASMGIAQTKLLAKIGSELNKPAGFFIVSPGTELAILDPLPVRALPGIGPAAETRLQHVGVTQVKHARGFERPELQTILGDAVGASLHDMVRAHDLREVQPHRVRKSISIEDTFPHDIRETNRVKVELSGLVDRLVTRMSRQGISGRTISVKLRDSTFTTTSKSFTLDSATHSNAVITATALRLLDGFSPEGGVRLLGVSVSGLSPWIQGDLFEQLEEAPDANVEPETEAGAGVSLRTEPVGEHWVTGMDVHHDEHGDGWVWGSGRDLVTVRFETQHTPPGPIFTFKVTDPKLHRGYSDTFEA